MVAAFSVPSLEEFVMSSYSFLMKFAVIFTILK